MSRLIINIKDESKKDIIINLLNEISFISYEEDIQLTETKNTSLDSIFGLWKDRSVSLSDIRDKAWKKNL